MGEELIREKVREIVQMVLEDNGNDIVIEDDDTIHVPFTIDGTNFNQASVLSSLEIVAILVEIEIAFGITISDEDMLNFRSINDLLDIVRKATNESEIEEVNLKESE